MVGEMEMDKRLEAREVRGLRARIQNRVRVVMLNHNFDLDDGAPSNELTAYTLDRVLDALRDEGIEV